METLKDWKTALASGVKIETLLGLDKECSQQQSMIKEDRRDGVEGNHSMQGDCSTDVQPLNLSVKTATGQQLDFQWSSPTLSTICPDVHNKADRGQSSIPSHMTVSPPSIPVKQIVGPCFIDISQVHAEQDKPGKETSQSPD